MAGRGFGEGGRKPAGGCVPKGPAADRPPEVRPRGQKPPPWSAAGRRPSPIARRGRAPQGASVGRLAALHSLGVLPRQEMEGRPPRASNNRGDVARFAEDGEGLGNAHLHASNEVWMASRLGTRRSLIRFRFRASCTAKGIPPWSSALPICNLLSPFWPAF